MQSNTQVPCKCAILSGLFLPNLPSKKLNRILVSLAHGTAVSFQCR